MLPSAKPSVKRSYIISSCSCSEVDFGKSIRLRENCIETIHEDSVELECVNGYFHLLQPPKATCLNGDWEIERNLCFSYCYVPLTSDILTDRNQIRKYLLDNEGTDLLSYQYESETQDLLVVQCENLLINKCTTTPKLDYSFSQFFNDGCYQKLFQCKSETTACELPNIPLNGQITRLDGTDVGDEVVVSCFGNEMRSTCTFADEMAKWYPSIPQTCATTTSNHCEYTHRDPNLLAFFQGNLLDYKTTLVINSGEGITFRCPDISYYAITGDSFVRCKESMSRSIVEEKPTCIKLKYRATSNAPVITYDIHNGDEEISNDGTLIVNEGAQLKLNCWWFQSRGQPTWRWNTEEIDFEDVAIGWQKRDNYQLRIDYVSEEHAGIYSCQSPHKMTHKIAIETRSHNFTFSNELDILAMTPTSTVPSTTTTIARTTLARTAISRTTHPRIIFPRTTVPRTLAPRPTVLSTTKSADYPIGNNVFEAQCAAGIYNGLVLYQNGSRINEERQTYDLGTILRFRCLDTVLYKFKGTSMIRCTSTGWTQAWPICVVIKENDWNSPPPVQVSSEVAYVTLDNGEIYLPRSASIYFQCKFSKMEPVVLLNGINVKLSPNMGRLYFEEAHGWIFHVRTHSRSARYNISCFVPKKPLQGSLGNSITIRYGDSCMLDDAYVFSRFGATINPTTKRSPFYVSGDVIHLQCAKRFATFPRSMTCATGTWSLNAIKMKCPN